MSGGQGAAGISFMQAGLYEHGEAFRHLMKEYPGDFEDFSDGPIPQIPADAYDLDGSYHEIKTDEWGVT